MVGEKLLTPEQVTGIYDLPTENAVKAFQSKYKIVLENH
jgi:peptidoglycan hydrolase-like protein with peptidoglycan-binding domain